MNGPADSQPQATAVVYIAMKPAVIFACALVASGTADAKPFKSELKNADADFSFSWSSEVAAVPPLVKRFTADMRKQKAATVTGGKEFNQMRKKMGSTGDIGYMHSTAIETAGQSARLLSLEIATASYTGGAHGNYGYGSLLWDRRLNHEISFDDLFIRKAGFSKLTRVSYCKALDAERLKRREGEKLNGEFAQCPPFSDLAIAPVDKDKDGRFERISFVAAPYTAGPFSEGEYALELPVTRQLMAAIKPLYRASFEPQRQ